MFGLERSIQRKMCVIVCKRKKSIVPMLESLQHYAVCPDTPLVKTTGQALATAMRLPCGVDVRIFAFHFRSGIRSALVPWNDDDVTDDP